MSESSAASFPKLRDLLAAKTGGLFFVKWLICSVLGVIIKGAYLALYVASGFRFTPGGNFLWWAIPVLLQVWCIFGFRWRTWAWIATEWYILWLLPSIALAGGIWALVVIPVRFLIKTLLLVGVRRHVGVWLLALTVSYLMESAAIWGTPLTALGMWLKQFQLGSAGSFWANTQIQQGPQFVTALILGAVLAWLMPPVDQPKIQGADASSGDLISDRAP